MSKYATRVSPRYQAMLTPSIAATAPRSYLIHWPSPLADQRVARLLSSVFCGMLPSSPLAMTDSTGSESEVTTCVRGLGGGWGAVRSVRSHASARAALTASDAF